MKLLSQVLAIVLLLSNINIAQGRYSEAKNNYVGNSVTKWVTPVRGIPSNAVIGDVRDGKPVFVARGYYGGKYHIGQTADNWGACIIGYKSKAVRVLDYQVLVISAGNVDLETISDEENRNMLNLIYEISDELKKDKYSIFVKKEVLKFLKERFTLLRAAAIKKQDKTLARKIDEILDSLQGAFVKVDELKKTVDQLEDLL